MTSFAGLESMVKTTLHLVRQDDGASLHGGVVMIPALFLCSTRHEVPIVVKQSIASRTNLFAVVLKEIILCTNVTKDLLVFMPYLLSFLLFRHDIPVVVKQSIAIASETNLFAAILKNMTLGRNVTEDLLMHDCLMVVKQSIASGTNLFAVVLKEMTPNRNVTKDLHDDPTIVKQSIHGGPLVVKQSIAIDSETNLFEVVLEEMTLYKNVTEDLLVLMPYLMHDGPVVVKQSIVSGAKLFAGILEEMTLDTNVMKIFIDSIKERVPQEYDKTLLAVVSLLRRRRGQLQSRKKTAKAPQPRPDEAPSLESFDLIRNKQAAR
ncbi:hypothetical protein U9M48_018322 [Paspalum notatum var. saurae]|uniref:Uncharacterized protein n=1 Tax=Paspalum notatum var. saurae TaxID=547442 RepID=A0AAQ3WQ19_PASNO